MCNGIGRRMCSTGLVLAVLATVYSYVRVLGRGIARELGWWNFQLAYSVTSRGALYQAGRAWVSFKRRRSVERQLS